VQFGSATFLLFLGLVFIGYWNLSRRNQNILLVAASYTFYGWWDYRFTFLMLFSTVVDFLCSLAIAHATEDRRKRFFLAVSITSNLGLLGFFKYFNFFQDSLLACLSYFGWELHPMMISIILPVGISFYTFQTMSYTIDVYRSELSPTRSFVDYLAYVSFFPQLVAGPIERGKQLLPQFQEKRSFSREIAVDGCELILWGLFKKLAVASNLALIADGLFGSLETGTGPLFWIATVAFAFQIYCDFSAYSDIAIGTAKLFGIRLMRNFAYPYFAQSLSEFWRRWHISLSTWFRDYVYIPMGGGRVSYGHRLFNVLFVFMLSGLWHGASWNFIIWGFIHGAVLVLESALSKTKPLGIDTSPAGTRLFPSSKVVWNIARTFLVTLIAWVFFRITSFSDAIYVLHKMFFDWQSLSSVIHDLRGRDLRDYLLHGTIALAVMCVVEWLTRSYSHPFGRITEWSRAARWAVFTFVIWSTLYLMPSVVGEFIYFQF